MKGVEQIADATCLACGCLCDDIVIRVSDDRIIAAERACPIGQQWFTAQRPNDAPACRILGMPASLDAGLARAAQILGAARKPLLVGLAGLTCEAQRGAVALVESRGGCLALGGGSSALNTAVQAVGMVTATLGEVRHRADLVIFWGVDPATTHPRHFERYSLEPRGEFVPRGRTDRTRIVVDSRRTPTADVADSFVQIASGAEREALDVLQLLVGDKHPLDAAEVEKRTGAALADWQFMAGKMKAAHYGAMFFDAACVTPSLLTLVRDLNRHTRFVCLPLGEAGNGAGAAQLVAWETGQSGTVDFAEGIPRAVDGASSADAAIVLACDPVTSLTAAPPAVPCIMLHTAELRPADTVEVAFTVATAGIHSEGTVFRSDGVPLPLRPVIESAYPSAEAVLRLLSEALTPVSCS